MSCGAQLHEAIRMYRSPKKNIRDEATARIRATRIRGTAVQVRNRRENHQRLRIRTDSPIEAMTHGRTPATQGGSRHQLIHVQRVDLAFDHHRYGPHSNLLTNIDLGKGSRMFQSGGGAKLGRHSAAYETFWCIRARTPQSWPRGWGPDLMNLVGVESSQESTTTIKGKWFETIPPERLRPQNLHEAQLERRLRRAR